LGDRVAYANSSARGKSTPLTKGSANPKAQPKSAVVKPNSKKGVKERAVGKAGKEKPKRMAKAKPKTAEELDAEMTDYFAGGGSTETAAATATQPAAGGEDLGMEEISVSDDDHEFIT
jgi:THO complex subunit 4